MRKPLSFLLLLSLLFSSGFCQARAKARPESRPAESAPKEDSNDPLVKIRTPRSYYAKKFFLLPLEIPSYVLKGVTYPLLELGKLLERHEGLFTFQERDWLILPLIEAGGGDGFGGGFFFQYRNLFDRGYRLRMAYQIHTNLDQRALIMLESPPVLYLWDRPLAYHIRVDFRNNPNARFYGIGSGSLESNRTEYGFDRVRGGVEFEYQLLDSLKLTVPVGFVTRDAHGSGGSGVSAEDVFPLSQLPGFDRRLNYFVTGVELTHDNSDSEVTPTRGGVQSFQFLRYQGLGNGGFDFNQYFLDLRQFVPLWTPRHVLALRNVWAFQQATGNGAQVPFDLLSQLDWKSLLRGFDRGRFRDTSYVLFNFEYRFPVWDFIEGVVFVDTGKVFHNQGDISFDHWKYAAGGGLRFILRNVFLLGLEVGYGGEGPRAVFRLGPSI